MVNVSKFRLPYRQDQLFGLLFLIALLIPLAFDYFNYENYEIIKFGLLMLLTGCACLKFVKKFTKPDLNSFSLRANRTFFLALVLFLVWALIASLLAGDKNYAFFGFYPRFTSGFLFYLVWSVLLFLLSGISQARLWTLIRVWFFCAGLTAVWGLLQSVGFGYYGGQTVELFSRAAPSFLGNPNFSGMFIACFVPVGLYLLYGSKNFWARVYYSLSLFLQIWAVIIFSSRGSLLAMFTGIFSAIALGLVFKKFVSLKFVGLCLLCLALALGLALGFFNFARPGALGQTISLKESNIQNRLGIWGLSWQAIKSQPIFGQGPGNFETFFESHRALSSITTGFFDDPHNLPLHLAVTGGLPLLLLFLFLIFYPLAVNFKKFLRTENSENVLAAIAAASAILAWLVAALFSPVAIPCYAALAFLISALFFEQTVFKFPKAIFMSLGRVLGWSLIIYALCFIAAEHLFYFSVKNYNSRKFLPAYKLARAAIYLNPANSLYYEYLAASSIYSGLPENSVSRNIDSFSHFHQHRSHTYIQTANLYYLFLYQTHNLAYKQKILDGFNTALLLDPAAANNYFSLGQFEFIFGNYDSAINNVRKGLNLSSQNIEAWMFLAKIYQLEGNRFMFLQTLESAARKFDDPTPFLTLLKFAKGTPDISKLPLFVHLELGRLD